MLTLAWHAHEIAPNCQVTRARGASHWRTHNSRERAVTLLLDEQRLDPVAGWFARQMARPRGATLCGFDASGKRWPVTAPRYSAAISPDPTQWLNRWVSDLQWGSPAGSHDLGHGLSYTSATRPQLVCLRVERWGIPDHEEIAL